MGKEGRRFLPNLKKLGSPRLNFDEVDLKKIKEVEEQKEYIRLKRKYEKGV